MKPKQDCWHQMQIPKKRGEKEQTMTLPFHPGELTVQARAGVQDLAGRIGRGIHSRISPAAQDFLHDQRMAVVSSIDANGQVWVSLLSGAAGFIHVVDEQTVWLDAAPQPGDPLEDNMRTGVDIGMLVINPATRRRIRVNGTVELPPQGGIHVHTEQVYGNCPKYIQVRQLHEETVDGHKTHAGQNAQRGSLLTEEQQRWIMQADTFFVGSFHPEGGADASHRGGNPGFVQVINGSTLLWPDYAGNNMFQTLGNIAANPHAGLLFVDFERGGTLQLTGKAQIIWEEERRAKFTGAERLIEFHIDQVIEIANTSPLRWQLIEYSPFNPT